MKENIEQKKFDLMLGDEDKTLIVLDLPRFSLYTGKNILEIFDDSSNILWIPNQVYKEYNSNKHKVLEI